MHDIKFIRQNPEIFDAGLARRGLPPMSTRILELDAAKRNVQTELQELQAKRNQFAKAIGEAKKKGEDATAAMDAAKANNERIAAIEADLETGGELQQILAGLPNIPSSSVPDGKDESCNVEVRRVGTPPIISILTPTVYGGGKGGALYTSDAASEQADSLPPLAPPASGVGKEGDAASGVGKECSPKEHFELGEALGLMDFEAAAKISGSRFVVLKGDLARMERALASFMLDIHTQEFGYTEINPPFLVRDNALYGTGQLPKFAEDLFKTENGYWLIPTAEVPLTNLVNDAILKEDQLPMRYTAYTPCFRSEAGAAGRDTRGMIRQHQFSKVELVSITFPEQSDAEHERMTKCAETILERLGLHFRTMLLCTGDMGFGSQKTYDIEVWLPGQNAYREISSCSNCGDFQARRMKARFKANDKKETEFVHTLNGSGLAIGRTMVAIMENYQQPDGSIKIPDALQPYMGGKTIIERKI